MHAIYHSVNDNIAWESAFVALEFYLMVFGSVNVQAYPNVSFIMNIMYNKYVRNLRHCENVGETLTRSDENFC